MGRPHPFELRQRVVAHVDQGNTHRSAALRYSVSVKFVNDMVRLKRETGSLAPKRQGNRGGCKLAPHEGWIRARVAAKGESRSTRWSPALPRSAVFVLRRVWSGGSSGASA